MIKLRPQKSYSLDLKLLLTVFVSWHCIAMGFEVRNVTVMLHQYQHQSTKCRLLRRPWQHFCKQALEYMEKQRKLKSKRSCDLSPDINDLRQDDPKISR